MEPKSKKPRLEKSPPIDDDFDSCFIFKFSDDQTIVRCCQLDGSVIVTRDPGGNPLPNAVVLQNLFDWLCDLMHRCGGKDVHRNDGSIMKGAIEGFAQGGLEKLNTSFNELTEWTASCRAANVFGGSMLSIVGTPARMSITAKAYSGPFGRW